MYGGNISSLTPAQYKSETGKILPENYQELNFNDFPNSIVFLWNIFLNNNWIELAYMPLVESKNPFLRKWGKYYFVFFSLFNTFFVLNMIIGKFFIIFGAK